MYDTQGNEHHICSLDNLLEYQQSHLDIHLKGKKPVLKPSNQKVFFSEKKLPLIKNLKIRSLTCFRHQVNHTAAQLFWKSVF